MDGCLSGPAAAGIFVLTEDVTGTRYNLTGNTNVLHMLVGSEVQTTGQLLATFADNGDNNSSTGQTVSSGGSVSGSGAGTFQSFEVSSAKKLFDHCGADSEDAGPAAVFLNTGSFELAATMNPEIGQAGSASGAAGAGSGAAQHGGSTNPGQTPGSSTPGQVPGNSGQAPGNMQAPGQPGNPGNANPAPNTPAPPPGTATPPPSTTSPNPQITNPNAAPGAQTPGTQPSPGSQPPTNNPSSPPNGRREQVLLTTGWK